MYRSKNARRARIYSVLALAVCCGIWLGGGTAIAQFGGGGGGLGGGGGGGGLGGGGGGGTIGTGPFSGVAIDADGVLRLKTVQDPTGQLLRERAKQAYAALDRDVAQKSDLRKVSLTRLERAVKKSLADGNGPDDAMLHLAGLTRIEYVFCYPETGDVVIAGPAEPWGSAPSGRKQGIETGAPVIELRDLVVALRCFPPSGDSQSLVYCSIDPTQEGLARMQETLRRLGRYVRPGGADHIVHSLRKSLGDQEITVGGISTDTHFAQVLVEADYRMKLIGIGLEMPPVRMVTYAAKSAGSRNALVRWYFVPDYECVRASEDGLAMQLVGEGVELVDEAEVVAGDGSRQRTGKSSRASRLFVNSFTKKYPQLAKASPVYAQLRNCIDMLVAAAFIQEQGYYGETNWEMDVFGDESQYAVETETAPEKVPPAINAIWRGTTLSTPIGGGVQIHPTKALNSANLLDDKEGAVASAREAIDLKSLPADQWWWD